MRNINLHIIHCSDSKNGDVKIIRQWHKERGFRDVGYHFIIRRDGEIELGRGLNEIGAHCKGYNRHSIGTCLIGKNNFTSQQFASLRKLQTMLQGLFSQLEIIPHNELNSRKSCPNFKVAKIFEKSLKKVYVL